MNELPKLIGPPPTYLFRYLGIYNKYKRCNNYYSYYYIQIIKKYI